MYTHNLDPVLFDFGFLVIRWYSLAYIFGILTSKDIQKEISTDLRFTRDKLINKLQLVSREEFDVLKKLVQKQEIAIKKLSKKSKIKKAKKS